MGLSRVIKPELLDELPASDPRAIASRRDLRLVNALMAQSFILALALRMRWQGNPPLTVLDLGCGDGTLTLRLAQRLSPRWRDVTVTLLDQQDVVSDETRQAFASIGWHAVSVVADARAYLHRPEAAADLIVTNLFLHHFQADVLSRMLSDVTRRTGFFIACEPRRARRGLLACKSLWLFGCNSVTLHDADASVRAGFAGKEISALWPATKGWTLRERAAGPFSHLFVAARNHRFGSDGL
jgi:SAM-dependent methyltransferase